MSYLGPPVHLDKLNHDVMVTVVALGTRQLERTLLVESGGRRSVKDGHVGLVAGLDVEVGDDDSVA